MEAARASLLNPIKSKPSCRTSRNTAALQVGASTSSHVPVCPGTGGLLLPVPLVQGAAPRPRQGRQVCVHHGLRHRLRQPPGPPSGQEGLQGDRLVFQREGGRGSEEVLLRQPDHNAPGRAVQGQRRQGRGDDQGESRGARPLGCGEQCRCVGAHGPDRLADHRRLQVHAGGQPLRSDRGDAERPADDQEGQGTGGQRGQRVREGQSLGRPVHRLQVRRGGLQRQPQVEHDAFRYQSPLHRAGILQNKRDRHRYPEQKREYDVGPTAPGSEGRLRDRVSTEVVRHDSQQSRQDQRRGSDEGGQLYGARRVRRPAPNPLLPGLGRQVLLAAAVVHAHLRLRLHHDQRSHSDCQAGEMICAHLMKHKFTDIFVISSEPCFYNIIYSIVCGANATLTNKKAVLCVSI